MKYLAILISACAMFALTPAQAANSQKDKMTQCNKDAAGKKGDERKAFMKDCLSAKTDDKPKVSEAQQAQRDKMGQCNKDAAGKKGDDRKAFMKDCLSK